MLLFCNDFAFRPDKYVNKGSQGMLVNKLGLNSKWRYLWRFKKGIMSFLKMPTSLRFMEVAATIKRSNSVWLNKKILKSKQTYFLLDSLLLEIYVHVISSLILSLHYEYHSYPSKYNARRRKIYEIRKKYLGLEPIFSD